jgi:hypothetical protein
MIADKVRMVVGLTEGRASNDRYGPHRDIASSRELEDAFDLGPSFANKYAVCYLHVGHIVERRYGIVHAARQARPDQHFLQVGRPTFILHQ